MGFFDLIFGKRKPKYPRITNDMLQPVDSVITTTDAKRIIKKLFLEIGYCEDKSEASYEAESLGNSIKDEEEALREYLAMAKDEYEQELAEYREEIRDVKAELASCKTADERQELKDEIAEIESRQPDDKNLNEAKRELAEFKANKRQFLITYINEQLHPAE